MNHFFRAFRSALFTGLLCSTALAFGTSALASTKDACSLVPLSQVQATIGSDGALINFPRNTSRNGVTASFCSYGSKAYGASLGYFTFATAAQAQSAFVQMKARAHARGYSAIKGTSIVSAFVNDNSSAHLEHKVLSRQIGAAMLSAI